MRKVVLHVTDVDSYLWDRRNDCLDAEKWARKLSDVGDDGTPQMRRGIKFAEEMEEFQKTGEWPRHPIHRFTCDAGVPRCDRTEYRLRQQICEVGNDRILLSGKVDGLCGDVVVDWKTTEKQVDWEKYADAFQWRAYLSLVPFAKEFRYHVFRVRRSRQFVGRYDVVEHQVMAGLRRYRGLLQDVITPAVQFYHFLSDLERAGKVRMPEKERH